VHQLAGTGHRWFTGLWKRNAPGPAGWNEKIRPRPDNITELTTPRDIIKGIEERRFDLAICPGLEHLSFLKDFSLPLVLYFEHSLPALARMRGHKPGALREEVHRWLTLKRGLFVTTSKGKYDSWKIEGEIVPPGISPGSYSGYAGDTAKALVVGNHLKENDYLTGWSNLRKLLTHFPHQILGHNPDIPQSSRPDGWEEMKKHFRTYRVIACALQSPYEDGWDLSLLEAMATGMPVIAVENPSSPVRDGVEGFITSDLRVLRSRLKDLLENHDLAFRLGTNARARALDLFPLARAHELWNNAFSKAIDKYQNIEGRHPRAFIPLRLDSGRKEPEGPAVKTEPEILKTGMLPLEKAQGFGQADERGTRFPQALVSSGLEMKEQAGLELPPPTGLEAAQQARPMLPPLAGLEIAERAGPVSPQHAGLETAEGIERMNEPSLEEHRVLLAQMMRPENAAEPQAAGLTAVQKEFIAQIPRNAATILDMGCGTGLLGEALKRRTSREVVGVESDRIKARKASLVLDEVVHGDAEHPALEDRDGYFDCALYFNILEEMKDPWRALADQARYVRRGGTVLVSFHNARYRGVVASLLQGKWSAREGFPGPRHLHLFALADVEDALVRAGYVIEDVSAFPGPESPEREKFENLVGQFTEGNRDLIEETRIRSYHIRARRPS
jgi:SAM-dependent methyltransferase